jgi:hypothetical protein
LENRQTHVNEWLINGEKPNILVEIRRGGRPPSQNLKKQKLKLMNYYLFLAL